MTLYNKVGSYIQTHSIPNLVFELDISDTISWSFVDCVCMNIIRDSWRLMILLDFDIELILQRREWRKGLER